MSKHTPLPLPFEADTTIFDSDDMNSHLIIISGNEGLGWGRIAMVYDECIPESGLEFLANFIVKACNLHYELVEALEALIHMPAFDNEAQCAAWEQAREALRKAKENE